MRGGVAAGIFLIAIAGVTPLRAQTDDARYTIMRPEPEARAAPPEPWLAPKYRSPRGTPQRVVIPRPAPDLARRVPAVPPPIVVPETGRVLPNIPNAAPGAGPGGRETLQDRSIRCAHQAGVYGDAAGNRNAYIGGCINQ